MNKNLEDWTERIGRTAFFGGGQRYLTTFRRTVRNCKVVNTFN
jgi:hypothetical protein